MNINVTSANEFEGYRITRHLGIVQGLIVRSPTIVQGLLGGLKSIIGGNVGAYTEMCQQARRQAYDQILQHAYEVGANGIIGFRYDASELGGQMSATEVFCYGTAVKIVPEFKE